MFFLQLNEYGMHLKGVKNIFLFVLISLIVVACGSNDSAPGAGAPGKGAAGKGGSGGKGGRPAREMSTACQYHTFFRSFRCFAYINPSRIKV